jgi:hypothetical protein
MKINIVARHFGPLISCYYVDIPSMGPTRDLSAKAGRHEELQRKCKTEKKLLPGAIALC